MVPDLHAYTGTFILIQNKGIAVAYHKMNHRFYSIVVIMEQFIFELLLISAAIQHQTTVCAYSAVSNRYTFPHLISDLLGKLFFIDRLCGRNVIHRMLRLLFAQHSVSQLQSIIHIDHGKCPSFICRNLSCFQCLQTHPKTVIVLRLSFFRHPVHMVKPEDHRIRSLCPAEILTGFLP